MSKGKRNIFKFFLENTIIAMLGFMRNKLVKPIQHQEVKQFTDKRLDDLAAIAKILTDADPNNQAQLEQLWQQQIKPTLQTDSLATAAAIIEAHVKDPDAKAALLSILASYKTEYGVEPVVVS